MRACAWSLVGSPHLDVHVLRWAARSDRGRHVARQPEVRQDAACLGGSGHGTEHAKATAARYARVRRRRTSGGAVAPMAASASRRRARRRAGAPSAGHSGCSVRGARLRGRAHWAADADRATRHRAPAAARPPHGGSLRGGRAAMNRRCRVPATDAVAFLRAGRDPPRARNRRRRFRAAWLRDDRRSPRRLGREHAVVADERIARRRNERGEACEELEPRHHAMLGASAPGILDPVGDSPSGEPAETVEREGRARTVGA